MEMYPISDRPGFSPTEEQLERESALKRFNRLYIYLPLGIVVLTSIFLLVLMLVGIFAPGLVGAEAFLSALADTILVLWMIPMMVLMAIVPIAYAAYLVNRRQRRNMLPPDSPLLRHSRVEMAMWQAQNILDKVSKKTDSVSEKIAQPLISINVLLAYVFAWLDILARPLRRNDENERDGAS
jgi:hypothetical protein